ncbi:response regulator [Rossellomorea sp. NPDC077527]|uniref:response regulator n=1 Tax=Rossellomorea sp. NPDC077527 TaxID=3364510 RepID=UPI0037CB4FBF
MIRIVIAEDQDRVLGTIGSLLNLEEDMEVVNRAKNKEHAKELIHQHRPDILLLDIETLLRDGPLQEEGCKLLVFTTFAKEGYLEWVKRSGAHGYLLKDSPSEELTSSIRSIMDGMRMYSPKLMEKAEPSLFETPQAPGPVKQNYLSLFLNKMKHPTG